MMRCRLEPSAPRRAFQAVRIGDASLLEIGKESRRIAGAESTSGIVKHAPDRCGVRVAVLSTQRQRRYEKHRQDSARPQDKRAEISGARSHNACVNTGLGKRARTGPAEKLHVRYSALISMYFLVKSQVQKRARPLPPPRMWNSSVDSSSSIVVCTSASTKFDRTPRRQIKWPLRRTSTFVGSKRTARRPGRREHAAPVGIGAGESGFDQR